MALSRGETDGPQCTKAEKAGGKRGLKRYERRLAKRDPENAPKKRPIKGYMD